MPLPCARSSTRLCSRTTPHGSTTSTVCAASWSTRRRLLEPTSTRGPRAPETSIRSALSTIFTRGTTPRASRSMGSTRRWSCGRSRLWRRRARPGSFTRARGPRVSNFSTDEPEQAHKAPLGRWRDLLCALRPSVAARLAARVRL
eukprot:Amastigsp_a176187_12.p5 type:complete len:145 gc:universal Amastigsp_a176187_12:291-725(+)